MSIIEILKTTLIGKKVRVWSVLISYIRDDGYMFKHLVHVTSYRKAYKEMNLPKGYEIKTVEISSNLAEILDIKVFDCPEEGELPFQLVFDFGMLDMPWKFQEQW